MKLISTFALLSTATAVTDTGLHESRLLRGRALQSQDASLSTVRIERGYTQATQAGVSVQRGITATMHYTYHYTGLTWQQVQTATQDYISTIHGSQRSQSESAFANGQGGVNGFWSFLDFNVGASGGWNSASSSNTVSGEAASHLHSLFSNIGSSATQDITLTGDITAVGQSYIPTEGFVFIRVISFHFEDGRTFTAVDTSGAQNSAIAATRSGDTSSLTTTSAPPAQLNILPASRQLDSAGPPLRSYLANNAEGQLNILTLTTQLAVARGDSVARQIQAETRQLTASAGAPSPRASSFGGGIPAPGGIYRPGRHLVQWPGVNDGVANYGGM